MTFYNEMQSVASELLAEFQQGEIIYREPGGEPDPWNPDGGEPVDYPLNATANGVGAQYAPDSLVQEGDIEVTCGVFGTEPTTSGQMLIDGKVHQIVKVKAIPAAGTPITWKVWCRV